MGRNCTGRVEIESRVLHIDEDTIKPRCLSHHGQFNTSNKLNRERVGDFIFEKLFADGVREREFGHFRKVKVFEVQIMVTKVLPCKCKLSYCGSFEGIEYMSFETWLILVIYPKP